jgi:hypothetical protein
MNAIGSRDVMSKIDSLGYKVKHIVDDVEDTSLANNSDIQAWWRLLVMSILFGGPVVVLHFSMIFSMRVMSWFDEPVS